MKRILPLLCPIGYGFFASLGIHCLINLFGLGASFAPALGHPLRYLALCGFLLLLSAAAIIGLLILNTSLLDAHPKPDFIPLIELLSGLILTAVGCALWPIFFDWLRTLFFG